MEELDYKQLGVQLDKKRREFQLEKQKKHLGVKRAEAAASQESGLSAN